MPSITQLTMPVTTLVSVVAGLWVIFQQFSAITEGIAELQRTHDRFEYEVRIIVAEDRMQELEGVERTEKQEREYARLQKAVGRYEEERDKLL